MTTSITGGELVVRTLEKAGVQRLFGLHGAHLETIFQSCRTHGIPVLDTRHEVAAGHAAEGYARATRKLGVAMITAGPGFTNVITSMANAFLDRTPVLYLSGAAALRDAETSTLQAGIDQVAIAQAIRLATSGPTGPVLLDLPSDVLGAQVEEGSVTIPDPIPLAPAAPAQEAVTRALHLLREARRPVIMAGVGAWQSACERELREFVESAGIPVFSDFQAHGLLP